MSAVPMFYSPVSKHSTVRFSGDLEGEAQLGIALSVVSENPAGLVLEYILLPFNGKTWLIQPSPEALHPVQFPSNLPRGSEA